MKNKFHFFFLSLKQSHLDSDTKGTEEVEETGPWALMARKVGMTAALRGWGHREIICGKRTGRQ